MDSMRRILILSRRSFVVSATATFCLPSALARAGSPAASVLERTPQFEDEFKKRVGQANPASGSIILDLPEIAENGNFVPVTVTVDSPMSDADYIKTIHILSTSNPVAHVATFHLSPLNAMARVQSRMRLAKTQEVIALAEQSNGSMLIATALVKVTIGGCAS